MNNFKNSRPGGRPSRPFDKSYRPGAQSSAPREMYDAECNKCHERCQVPFRPNGKKPVYCANCFTREESRDSYEPKRTFAARPMRSESSHSAPDPQLQELKKQMGTLNATLEKLVVSMEAFNRANALSREVRKHMPADKPAPAPSKAVRKVAKKVAKK